MFLFHIDWTLTVAMVAENGHQPRLKLKNVILTRYFQLKSGGLTGKLTQSTSKYQNLFQRPIIGNKIQHIDIPFWCLAVLISNFLKHCLLILRICGLTSKWHFLYFSLNWPLFSVIITTVQVKLI